MTASTSAGTAHLVGPAGRHREPPPAPPTPRPMNSAADELAGGEHGMGVQGSVEVERRCLLLPSEGADGVADEGW
ncbi:hypothetical protein OHB00_17845 [Streptomyces sp. NBC_00631]|uniref:hypothetical protein n=1 Tax=Streptomyces sp. NBC_00631 TaxID=2975793 RepID=UPI0030DE13DC